MENELKELKVVSIDELRQFANGEIVPLPGFVQGTTFNVRLKRPSILAMAKCGKIPNELLLEANSLFTNGTAGVANKKVSDTSMLNDMFNILELICEESFVEPTYKQIKDAGVTLTDEQQLAVFQYTQNGIDSLKSFRQ